MVKSFCDIARSSGINPVDFYQGTLAHPQRATTRLLQNVKLDYLNGWMDERPEGQEGSTTSTLSKTKWCPGLRRAIVDGIRALGIGDGRDRGGPGDTCELRKLTKEQGWQLHLQRDHVPYRKDCEQCVMSLGTGRPHRRTKQKSAYVLSVDIGGPLRATSRDGHGYG